MRIVRCQSAAGRTYGIVVDGEVYAVKGGDPFAQTPARGARLGALDQVELLAPCEPTKIVAIGRNYVAHAQEHGADVPTKPLIFLKPPSAIVGPGQPVVLTPQSKQVEHESELAVVIGAPARQVSRDHAMGCIFGYTCGNDVTARDLQNSDGQWTRAKGFDTFCPLGPWIETSLNPADVGVRCLVNGQERQAGRTSQLVFDVPYLVSYISHIMTLMPGDVIMTGTPAGVGPLVAGDVVEVEIESIGTLRNPVTE